MMSLLLHRRRDLWGNKADEFDPGRWLDEEYAARVSATPFMYCPFSGGPRIVEYLFWLTVLGLLSGQPRLVLTELLH